MLRRIASLGVALFGTAVGLAAVIRVPADQPTIQAGLNAAASGDTVLVADGTYTGTSNKNLDFAGKAITLASENGADVTIIDCQFSGRGLLFDNGETNAAVVRGFTIRNGVAPGAFPNNSGGGIYCNGGSPTIEQCVIENNTAGWGGGGVHCNNSNAIVQDNEVRGNTAFYAGGIGCVGGDPTVRGNFVHENTATDFDGGGVYCRSTSPDVTDNLIASNDCGRSGGGIFMIAASPFIANNIIVENVAADDGGGIYAQNFCSPTIIHNTIVDNIASSGGGLGARLGCNLTVTNSIIWGNAPNSVTLQVFSRATITFSDVQGGFSGTGNINADPALDASYHLLAGSPCIGAAAVVGGMPTTDIDGDPRPNPPGSDPDMGADESPL